MRPLLVLVMAVAIFGGVQAFLASDIEPLRPASPVEPNKSSHRYDVEITLTFDAGADAFSIENTDDAPSLLVQLNGQSILHRTDDVPSSESPILIPNVPGVVHGRNEFYIQSSPAQDLAHAAVRVRILQDDDVRAESTLWSEFGGIVQGTVVMEVAE